MTTTYKGAARPKGLTMIQRDQHYDHKYQIAYQLRQKGLKYKAIGQELDISDKLAFVYVRHGAYMAARETKWWHGLSTRAANVLDDLANHPNTVDEARKAFIEAQNHPQFSLSRLPRNCGKKTYYELCNFFDLPLQKQLFRPTPLTEAAPDLLEALNLALATVERLADTPARIGSVQGTLAVCKQAITKAGGTV